MDSSVEKRIGGLEALKLVFRHNPTAEVRCSTDPCLSILHACSTAGICASWWGLMSCLAGKLLMLCRNLK